MDNNEVVSVLKDLIQTVQDGKEGFELAAEATENPDMRLLFRHYSAQREQFALELHHLITEYGDSSTGIASSLGGVLHRGWIDLRSILSAHDTAALLSECERGEDHAMDVYRHAIDLPLPTDVVRAIGAQSLEIKGAHDKVRYLRDLALSA